MRIVFIISGLGIGGAEIMLLNLLRGLDKKRFSALVISLTTIGDVGLKIIELGIPVLAIGMKPQLSSFTGLFRLVRSIREFRPDIVHTWMYHADLLGGLAARFGGFKYICWGVRSSNLDADKTSKSTRIVRKICALLSYMVPKKVLYNSVTASRIHLELGYARNKTRVIPNGFDVTRFFPDPIARESVFAELEISCDLPLVGMVGRFDPLKNHDGFCKAMAILQSRIPGINFLLAGKDVDYENKGLLETMRLAGVSDNFHLLGSRADMPRLMAALDVLICPSHAEAFPNVVGEAMACGIPCVVTDVGDSAYLVGDAGRVVKVGDMQGLATEVESILNLPLDMKSKIKESARRRIIDNFSIEEIVAKYQYTYEASLTD